MFKVKWISLCFSEDEWNGPPYAPLNVTVGVRELEYGLNGLGLDKRVNESGRPYSSKVNAPLSCPWGLVPLS